MYNYSIQQLKEMKTFFYSSTSPKAKIKNLQNILSLLDSIIDNKNGYTETLIFENSELISNLIIQFSNNSSKISVNSQKTFWHELGHVYNALTIGYKFTIIILNDKSNCMNHLFFSNPQKYSEILYEKIPVSKFNTFWLKSNGIAIYHDTRPDDVKVIALGGFMQDFVNKKKNTKEIVKSFGLNPKTIKAKKHSDFYYITKNTYTQKNNLKWKAIHDYLYNDKKPVKRYLQYPIYKYKKILELYLSKTSKVQEK
ncbi:hypothetical protein FG877_00155 [Enterococcus casseliflavus]|nr:hypothetical protein [Enterococcus casseliflavus]